MSMVPPTYEDLAKARAAEWAASQATAAKAQADLQATILKMPDVAHAPSPDLPWQHPDLACAFCAEITFFVTRWVTVNGVRHRAELKCAACQSIGTWDWTDKRWLEDGVVLDASLVAASTPAPAPVDVAPTTLPGPLA
jgi:hypothetical protein